MASAPRSFYCLWQEERIRETLFEMLPKEDICSVRLANSACCNLVTKRLFLRTHLAFTANTFTKASRVQALSRIGHHVEHLTFYLEHSEATFLPPLIHPLTGREISFLYTPHTCMASVLTRPKYTNTELGDVLTQQYPPLFHAATNVPSFLNAMKHMPNIRHLTIKCPGQDPKERYRRSIVDYALISLRISIERAPLHKLCKLSLSGVHPAAFNYLRHVPGFGSHPSAARRWRQIRKLYMSVDAWDFYGPSPGLDHLKIMDDFIRNMAPHLEKFSFTWLGDKGCSSGSAVRKGPCPIALSGDSLFSPRPEGPKKLFNEVTGPMSPLPPAPRREPMHFPQLRCLTIRNATMNTPQLRDLVDRHNQNVREFDFENVSLVDGGSYEEAFSQLLGEKGSGGHKLWSRTRKGDSSKSRSDAAVDSEIVVPASYDNSGSQCSPSAHKSFHFAATSYTGSLSSASSTVVCGPGAVASPDDVELSSPSAAVAAVSRELLDLDVEDLDEYLGFGSALPFMLDSPSDVSVSEEARPFMRTPPPPPIEEEDEEFARALEGDNEVVDNGEVIDDDGGLASDIAAAQEASLTFTTRFKKRRIRRSHRRHHSEGDKDSRDSKDTEERRSRSHRHHDRHHDGHSHSHSHSHGHSHSHHRHHSDQSESKSHSRKREDRHREETSRSHSRSRSHGRRKESSRSSPSTPPPVPALALAVRGHPFAHRTPPPQPPQPRPAIVGQCSAEDDVFRPRIIPDSPALLAAAAEVAPLNISAPILVPDPMPVVLQPTVYDPSAAPTAMLGLSRSASNASSSFGRPGSAVEDDGLSAIQRQILQEEKDAQMAQNEKRQMMADDAEARTSALKKAKEAVLAKLSREFNRRMGRETAQVSMAASAATMAAAAASVSMGVGHNYGSSRPSEDNYLFDSQHNNNAATATLSLLAGLRLRERLFGEPLSTASPSSSHMAVPTVAMDHYQHRSMESNSAVVPLIFSRA